MAISASGVRLFTWVQGAAFYRDLHRHAVELLPKGDGEPWLDAGCGPGLVSRLAAERGYRVLGIDSDERMIRAARRLARRAGSSAVFEVRSVFDIPPEAAHVVSACSLLAVLDDKPRGLQSLWTGVRSGGSLLVVEPTERMRPEDAKVIMDGGLPAKRVQALAMWAAARKGRAVPRAIFGALAAEEVEKAGLLGGLVEAWIFHKAPGGRSASPG